MLVVGLGNPGARYAETRHNLGFRVVEELALRARATWTEKFNGRLAVFERQGQKVLLLEPQTFMNRSGQSVVAAMRFYKLGSESLLVAHDELDLPLGVLRLKRGGSEAGHNGLRSISEHLGSRDYLRLRLGVGKPPPEFAGDTIDFLLQALPPAQRAAFDPLVRQAADAVELVVDRGLDFAMNTIHRRA